MCSFTTHARRSLARESAHFPPPPALPAWLAAAPPQSLVARPRIKYIEEERRQASAAHTRPALIYIRARVYVYICVSTNSATEQQRHNM